MSEFELRESDSTTWLACLPFEAEGFTAVFSTRTGTDHGESIGATAERLLTAIGRSDSVLATCKQVHSTKLKVIRADAEARDASTECDALTTSSPDLLLGVKTADCVPVLIADRRTGAVAAIHAGWRGTAGRIVERTFAAMIGTWSTRRGDCLAAIGPAICAACYEVGPEVIERFKSEFPYAKRFVSNETEDGKGHVDLPTACRIQLELCGMHTDQIFATDHCTKCHNELYFSYRVEGGKAGRILSLVGRV